MSSNWKRLAAALLVSFMTLLMAQEALATHFRYGNITWRIPDPVNAPRTVEFTVTTAWRDNAINSVSLNFGNGSTATVTQTQIGSGLDAKGTIYDVAQGITTHTYSGSQTEFTAFFRGCCRISTLINAADDGFRLETKVSLRSGNTGGPVSGVPVIIQFEIGKVNQFVLPTFDPDADPFTCGFAAAGSSNSPGTSGIDPGPHPPVIPATNKAAEIKFNNSQCILEWDTTGGVTGQQFALQILVDSTHGGASSTAPIAAGKIHSDLQRGFIRAEVLGWDDWIEHGSEAAAKAAGVYRVEGKGYVVQDGDILHIRSGV